MMDNKSAPFKGIGKNGEDVELAVRRPTAEDNDKAKSAYNIALKKALDGGAMFKVKLESYMREQNLWDDTKQKKLSDIYMLLSAGQTKLEKGGITLAEARKVAIEMARARREYMDLMRDFNAVDVNTAESQARDAEFNSKVATCTVYNLTGTQYYKDLKEYLADESDIATQAANALADLLYDLSRSDRELPENKFLLKYKLVDENLRLINKDGKFIDEDNNLVNELGQRVNENNEVIDKDGNVVKPESTEFKPFLDDDGQPIV